MEPPPLLNRAQHAFDHGKLAEAWTLLTQYRVRSPDDSGSLLLEARLHRLAGDWDAAEAVVLEAIEAASGFEAECYLEWLRQRAERQLWGRVQPDAPQTTRMLIDRTIGLCQDAASVRWRLGRLHVLRALATLAAGDIVGAEAGLARAYQIPGYPLRDREFLFPWVAARLAEAEQAGRLASCPTLRYLAWVARTPAPVLRYPQQLAKLDDDCFALEIGAMDGAAPGPLPAMLSTRPWRAVLVEPVSAMFTLLQRRYGGNAGVRCVQAALCGHDGVAEMHFVEPDSIASGAIGEWSRGMAKLTPLPVPPALCGTETVPAMTFETLVRTHGIERIDVLQIDTGGHEHEIFRQIDLSVWRIRLLRIALPGLPPAQRIAIADALRKHGYRLSLGVANLTALRAP